MTVHEAISRIQEERQQKIPSRFHCRAVMVQTIQQYSELINQLKNIPGIEIVSVEDLFSDYDVMPDYSLLCQKEYENKWLLLPGVSEYLRLFHISEESVQRFSCLWHYQFDANSTGRILIPLWGCETLWFDKSIHLNDDERQREYYYDCTNQYNEEQHFNIQVFSSYFEQYIEQIKTDNTHVFYGLKDWYSYWYNPKYNETNHLVITNRYKSVKTTEGDISIHVVGDLTAFINEKMHLANLISNKNCSTEAQELLFMGALKGLTLDEAILQTLNINEIKPVDVMSKWSMLSFGRKELILLWYKLHPDTSFLSYCAGVTNNPIELPNHILLDIFAVHNNHPEWVEEARNVVDVIPIKRNETFFNLLDEIPSFEDRLNYLSAKDSKERIYVLHLIGEWLRDDKESVFQCLRLKEIFPSLLAYLSDGYSDDKLNSYFSNYKLYKLSNTLPQSEELYFNGIDPEEYNFRYPVIAEVVDNQTFILWIDALGAEWAPLLNWALTNKCIGNIESYQIVQTQLPSETRFNDQWTQMSSPYEKYDKLDKLAHKGVVDDKDYYACIDEQISFVCEIVNIVNDLLRKYPRVIITGDHGTSRLAARFFHVNSGMPVPSHAEVGSHGRYCKVNNKPDHVFSSQRVLHVSDDYYIVYSNYDHYSKSGFAAGADDDDAIYGEIHGGATPEEMLVPVFTLYNPDEIEIQAYWKLKDNHAKVSNRTVRCPVHFSKPVAEVQASAGSYVAECISNDKPSQDWVISFSGIKLNKIETFEVTIIADGMFVDISKLEIEPALGGNDPF